MSDELAKAIEKHAVALQSLADAEVQRTKQHGEALETARAVLPALIATRAGFNGETRVGDAALLGAFRTVWDVLKGEPDLVRALMAAAEKKPEAMGAMIQIIETLEPQRATVS